MISFILLKRPVPSPSVLVVQNGLGFLLSVLGVLFPLRPALPFRRHNARHALLSSHRALRCHTGRNFIIGELLVDETLVDIEGQVTMV